MSNFRRISVTDAQALMRDANPLLLDCRDVNSYQTSHVENALHVHDDLVKSLISKGDKSQPLVIYCYHGHSSQHLAEMLANFGFSDVSSVDGGFEEWKKAL